MRVDCIGDVIIVNLNISLIVIVCGRNLAFKKWDSTSNRSFFLTISF